MSRGFTFLAGLLLGAIMTVALINGIARWIDATSAKPICKPYTVNGERTLVVKHGRTKYFCHRT